MVMDVDVREVNLEKANSSWNGPILPKAGYTQVTRLLQYHRMTKTLFETFPQSAPIESA